MRISYCTTCHNRLFQLKQTLEKNLKFTKKGEVELCVVAFNDDDVEGYLKENFLGYLKDGRLKVQSHKEERKFSCGYAKNLSHAMATGEILFNLDADNFIDNAHEQLLQLNENEVLKNIALPDGRSGRIGVHKILFDKVGGYRDVDDADDIDFIQRCLENGAKIVHTDCNLAPISNTPE